MLVALLISISIGCIIYTVIDRIGFFFDNREEQNNNRLPIVIDNCIHSFKKFPDKIKDNPIMKDIFKLLVSTNDDENFELSIEFVYEFNSLINTDEFRLFMERNYVDGYFSVKFLNVLKSKLDDFFTFKEGYIYNTAV